MEKITWYMNEHGDVEVWKGDWSIREVEGYVSDLYVNEKHIKPFFHKIQRSPYEIECGDWDTAEAYWEEIEGVVSA
jgi:hypothetical protein